MWPRHRIHTRYKKSRWVELFIYIFIFVTIDSLQMCLYWLGEWDHLLVFLSIDSLQNALISGVGWFGRIKISYTSFKYNFQAILTSSWATLEILAKGNVSSISFKENGFLRDIEIIIVIIEKAVLWIKNFAWKICLTRSRYLELCIFSEHYQVPLKNDLLMFTE